MEAFDADALTVTLAVQDWNTLLFVLDEVAMAKRVTFPLSEKLMKQLQPQQQQNLANLSLVPKTNGSGKTLPAD